MLTVAWHPPPDPVPAVAYQTILSLVLQTSSSSHSRSLAETLCPAETSLWAQIISFDWTLLLLLVLNL